MFCIFSNTYVNEAKNSQSPIFCVLCFVFCVLCCTSQAEANAAQLEKLQTSRTNGQGTEPATQIDTNNSATVDDEEAKMYADQRAMIREPSVRASSK